MFLAGLRKLTLLDFPGKTACTIFTMGCNFRCPFCHNSSLVENSGGTELLSEEEILEFLKTRRSLLDGVAITGGEPLIHRNLPAFMRKIKDLGYQIKLDTNGYKPAKLEEVIEAGLVDKVAMDIKNSPALYPVTTGDPYIDIGRIRESVNLLMSGKTEYEFRTTVVKGLHTDESMMALAHWIEDAKQYYLQFYVDSGLVLDPQGLSSFSNEEMKHIRDLILPILPVTQLRGI